MPLLIGIDHTQLDPHVAQAFDELIAAIQTWSASPLGLTLPRLRAFLPTNQTIVTGTDPAIVTGWATTDQGTTFAELAYDSAGLAPSGGRVTLHAAGIYLMQASVAWTANAAGFRYVGVFKDGSTLPSLSSLALTQVPSPSAANTLIISTPALIVPVTAPPQQFYVGVFQSSGGNLDVVGDVHNTWWQVTKIG